MAAKSRKKAVKAHPAARRTRAEQAATAVRETWHAALDSLSETEATVEKQVKQLLKSNRIDAKDAGTLLASMGAALDRGRKQAVKDLEVRLGEVQERLAKERKALGRAIDDGVQSALATFNIPSRKEVAELTRKVDALSKKIDGLRRRK